MRAVHRNPAASQNIVLLLHQDHYFFMRVHVAHPNGESFSRGFTQFHLKNK